MPWIKVAAEAEFTEPVRVVDYDGIDIAVFRLEDGFYAIDDLCSHAEASLAEGDVVNGCEIECPLHGARFDIRTGKNLSAPAVVPVDAYPVKVEEGVVYVEVED